MVLTGFLPCSIVITPVKRGLVKTMNKWEKDIRTRREWIQWLVNEFNETRPWLNIDTSKISNVLVGKEGSIKRTTTNDPRSRNEGYLGGDVFYRDGNLIISTHVRFIDNIHLPSETYLKCPTGLNNYKAAMKYFKRDMIHIIEWNPRTRVMYREAFLWVSSIMKTNVKWGRTNGARNRMRIILDGLIKKTFPTDRSSGFGLEMMDAATALRSFMHGGLP